MPETSTCQSFTCRTTVDGSVEKCPKCGTKMRTPKIVRRMGWFLLLLGIFLIGMMGILTYNLAPMMTHPGDTVEGGSRFTGTADQGRTILRLFALVFAFGLATTINGIWQIRTGQRSKTIMWIVLGIAAALGVFAFMASKSLG